MKHVSAPRFRGIISGNTTAIDMDRLARCGCRVIQKPVSLEELDAIVKETVARVDPGRALADFSA